MCSDDLQQLPAPMGIGGGPGSVSAYLARQYRCGPLPHDLTVFFAQHAGMRCLLLILWLWDDRTGDPERQYIKQYLCAQVRQFNRKAPGRIIFGYRHAAFEQHWTCIYTCIDEHDGHTCLAIALQNGLGDG